VQPIEHAEHEFHAAHFLEKRQEQCGLAARDLVRNVAIVDALIVVLCILALTPRSCHFGRRIFAVCIRRTSYGAICSAVRNSCFALLAEAAGGALGACREFLKSDLSAAG